MVKTDFLTETFHQTFVKWLRSYGLENFIGWLGKLNIYELKDLQVLSRQSLESGLRKSGMDFL